MKVKNDDLRNMLDALNEVSQLPGKEFAEAVKENRRSVYSRIVVYNSELEIKRTPEYEAFKKEENALVKKHCKLDGNGQPLYQPNNGGYQWKNREQFFKDYDGLKLKHPEAVKQIDAHTEFKKVHGQEECEVEITIVPYEKVSEQINADQMEALEFMIGAKNLVTH